MAVVVNYRQKLDAKRQAGDRGALRQGTGPDREPDQAKRWATPADRGDSLNVVNSPFTDNAEKEPELPLWSNRR